jgi:hypothetical protein
MIIVKPDIRHYTFALKMQLSSRMLCIENNQLIEDAATVVQAVAWPFFKISYSCD